MGFGAAPAHAALFLNRGYPLNLDEEFEITLPVRAETPMLPAVCTDSQGPLRWRIEWATISDGRLAARFHAELEGRVVWTGDIPVPTATWALLCSVGKRTRLRGTGPARRALKSYYDHGHPSAADTSSFAFD